MPQATVRIDEKGYIKLKSFSEKTGVPMSFILDELIEDWVEKVMPARLKALGK